MKKYKHAGEIETIPNIPKYRIKWVDKGEDNVFETYSYEEADKKWKEIIKSSSVEFARMNKNTFDENNSLIGHIGVREYDKMALGGILNKLNKKYSFNELFK